MERTELGNLVIRRIRSVQTMYTDGGFEAHRSFRPCWAIVLKWEGLTEYRLPDGTCVRSDIRHPVLLPYGSRYDWRCLSAGRYTSIEFEADGEGDQLFSFSLPSGEHLRDQMCRIERMRGSGDPFARMKMIDSTYRILLELLSANSTAYVPKDKIEKIRPAVDYIRTHYDAPLTNEELSAMTNVSTVYFRKLFTSAFGMSPIRYAQSVRIRKAMEMLQSDCGSITNVALSLGYQNVCHFSKAFKKAVGLSPTAYTQEEKARTDTEKAE